MYLLLTDCIFIMAGRQFIVSPNDVLTAAQVAAEGVQLRPLMMQLSITQATLNGRPNEAWSTSLLCHRGGVHVTLISAPSLVWRCPRCRCRKSVRSDSFCYRSKIPLDKLIIMGHCWADDMSQYHIGRVAEFNSVRQWWPEGGGEGGMHPGRHCAGVAFRGAKKDWNWLVFHLSAVSILKMSKCWWNNDCTHSHSADLLRGKPVYRFGHVSILLCLLCLREIR